MAERRSFVAAMVQVSPPWLRRTFGKRLMESLGVPVDEHVDRAVAGVKARFPNPDDPEALAVIGNERRIRRGPGETAETYAKRLRNWWDDHRTRGGPYALLRQLHLFWDATLNVPIECVYHSGTRRSVDADGVITRDAITWDADGTAQWSQFWLFFRLDPSTLVTELGDVLVTETGAVIVTAGYSIGGIVTEGGHEIVTEGGLYLASGDLDDFEDETFRAVPREWSAAHILRITIVILYGTGRLWNYPQPVPTWTAWGASGATWGGGDQPIFITVED